MKKMWCFSGYTGIRERKFFFLFLSSRESSVEAFVEHDCFSGTSREGVEERRGCPHEKKREKNAAGGL